MSASSLRLLAILPAVAGMVLAAIPDRPDAYVARDGSGAALRGADGRLVLVGRPADFTAEQWLRADGDARKAKAAKTGAACDTIGCVVRMKDGAAAAYISDRRAFPEDCARAKLVISRLPAPKGCAAALVIDRDFLTARGATAVRIDGERMAVDTARRPGETRAWQRRPAAVPKAVAPAAAPQSGAITTPQSEPEPAPTEDDAFAP